MAHSSGNSLLGYIYEEHAQDTYRGALLVTDSRGIPKDFRYTEPIKPSKLEKVLYGNALGAYLLEEVILNALVEALSVSPSLWLCERKALFLPLYKKSKIPTLLLHQGGHAPLDHVGQIEPQPQENTFLVQLYALSDALRVEVPEQETAKIEQHISLLQEIAETMDIMEPFNRISSALTTVEQEEASPQSL
ncbi:MAG TPA: hypothetical protein PK364_03720 [Synergistaceae bacterium]|nr:hypothetical protein [Synergistaceae bacterium]HPJ25535.1 hypothetical protein [Synergistaceae bacterium]HPQ36516.1 hypothetical protein [Synergistaceae bacterium]